MSTKDIRTSAAYTACDVCGRTLLRGERADVYLGGGARKSVCELCKERALHEGWVREGTVPNYEESEGQSDRRRSLFSRLLTRRDASRASAAPPAAREQVEEQPWSDGGAQRIEDELLRGRGREPRHVRAVPTSVEHKVASAIELFNDSEHPRTVAGVARSLGGPAVSVSPSDARASLVNVVVSWELCWYRYEVDLSDDQPVVRVAAQGYELSELTPQELTSNAVADERGSLSLAG